MSDKKRSGRDPAMLKCANTPSCGDMVLHQFLKTRPCTIRSESEILQDAAEELYACSKCGTARRWGIGASVKK